MELLKQRILEEGTVKNQNVLKVDSFLNHQLDIELLNNIGLEFKKRFQNDNITKILTIESSGIAIACMTAFHMKVPVIFAKKSVSLNLDESCYESDVYSFTKQKFYKIYVSKKYLSSEDNILIVDDFLAMGSAASGLIDIVKKSGATLSGIGIVIEKGFQDGGRVLRSKGLRIESLVIIDSIENGNIVFR